MPDSPVPDARGRPGAAENRLSFSAEGSRRSYSSKRMNAELGSSV